MSRSYNNLFVTIGSEKHGATGIRSVARVACTVCPATASDPIATSKHGLNPKQLKKRWEAAGWQIPKQDSKSHILCPDCLQARREARRTDPCELIRTYQIPAKENAVTVTQTNQDHARQNTPVRDPTHEERLKIRGLLDTYFDDKLGSYLSGYSDQKIGNELNVPWAIVTKIREAAYGPIRVDPEVEKLNAEVMAVGAQARLLAKQMIEINARVAELEKQAKALRERRAA